MYDATQEDASAIPCNASARGGSMASINTEALPVGKAASMQKWLRHPLVLGLLF